MLSDDDDNHETQHNVATNANNDWVAAHFANKCAKQRADRLALRQAQRDEQRARLARLLADERARLARGDGARNNSVKRARTVDDVLADDNDLLLTPFEIANGSTATTSNNNNMSSGVRQPSSSSSSSSTLSAAAQQAVAALLAGRSVVDDDDNDGAASATTKTAAAAAANTVASGDNNDESALEERRVS